MVYKSLFDNNSSFNFMPKRKLYNLINMLKRRRPLAEEVSDNNNDNFEFQEQIENEK